MSRERSTSSEKYISKLFAQEDGDLKSVREALIQDEKIGINVSASEGKILHFLVKLARAKTIVEVGVLYGYSTIWMAKALPEGGKIIAIEKSPENYEKSKKLIEASDVSDKIDLRLGDAISVLSDLNIEPDLIFIDADKGGYKDYLNWSLENVSKGGLIIGDNTFLFGHMIGEDRGEKTTEKAKASMSYFNETLAEHKNFCSVILPTHEGMTLGLRLD